MIDGHTLCTDHAIHLLLWLDLCSAVVVGWGRWVRVNLSRCCLFQLFRGERQWRYL